MRKNAKITDEDFKKMKMVYNDSEKHINNDHFYLSYSIRITLMIVAIIVIALMALKFYRDSFTEGHKAKVAISEKGDIDYQVKLLDNNLFQDGVLLPSEHYISDVVDDISTDLMYQYRLDSESDVQYSYYVTTLMELINNDNDVTISKREQNLLEKQEFTEKNIKEINIKQNINLDYDDYNNMAKSIVNQYGVNLNGKLKLIMYIDMTINNKKISEPLKHQKELVVEIPLLSDSVKVNMVDKIDEQNTWQEHVEPKLINKISLYISMLLIIIDTLILLITCSFIIRTIPKKSLYNKTLRRILNNYDEKIVNCKKLPNFEEYKIIECTSFKELMDASNILDKPILYDEVVKNQKCVFLIVSENNLYKYVLKECDIDF